MNWLYPQWYDLQIKTHHCLSTMKLLLLLLHLLPTHTLGNDLIPKMIEPTHTMLVDKFHYHHPQITKHHNKMLFEGCETLGYFSLWRPQPRLSQPLQLVGPSATSPLWANIQFMIAGIEGALILTLTWKTNDLCNFFEKYFNQGALAACGKKKRSLSDPVIE